MTIQEKELAIGERAPDFTMPATGVAGDSVSLTDFAGKNLVLYFYPKDNTSGCTIEAQDFAALAKDFARLDTVIIGVSKDSLKSHCNFAAKYQLAFPLISDEEVRLCMAYGVWKEKSNYGKKYMGIERSTFLIDKKGIIRQIWRKVKVDGHADEVLATVKEL